MTEAYDANGNPIVALVLIVSLIASLGVLAWRLSHVSNLLKWSRETGESLGKAWAKSQTDLVRARVKERKNTEEILALSNRVSELEENGRQLEVSRATNGRLRKELSRLQKQLRPPTKTKKGAKPV